MYNSIINTLRSVHLALAPQSNSACNDKTRHAYLQVYQQHNMHVIYVHAHTCMCTHITHYMTNSFTSYFFFRTGTSIKQVIHVASCIKACMPNSTSRSCFACLSTLTCAASKYLVIHTATKHASTAQQSHQTKPQMRLKSEQVREK